MTDLTEMSALKLLSGIKNKKFSCNELMHAYLARIREVNPAINAVVQQLNEDQAITLAENADELISRGKITGKLHGLPITIKDHLKVKDFIVTRGSMGLKNNRCAEDASIVKRLKDEGAIIIGITNMPEMGPVFESDNDVYGQTKNPYDLSKTSGGSSGGEAAIIASGGSVLGIGTDGGGSIRVPAHFCGIAGLKPTQHLVPCSGNVPADGGMAMLFYTPGPMSRYVEDLRWVLPIISGWDGIDPHIIPTLPSRPKKTLEEMRIGYILGDPASIPTSNTVSTLQNVINTLNKRASAVVEIDFLNIGYIGKFHWETYFYGGDQGNYYNNMLKKLNVDKPSPPLQRFLAAASKAEIYDAAEIKRRFFETDQIKIQALQNMLHYDVIICPACATPAKTHGSTQDQINDFVYTMAFNLLGWPACVVRCGETFDGLPIGVQIVAKPWDDDLTLTVAEFLQNELGGWKKIF